MGRNVGEERGGEVGEGERGGEAGEGERPLRQIVGVQSRSSDGGCEVIAVNACEQIAVPARCHSAAARSGGARHSEIHDVI